MIKFIKENASLIVVFIACIMLLIYEPLIFELDNITNIFKQASLIGIFSLAQSFVLIPKGLDLSQGGNITVISVCVALLSIHTGLPLAILIGISIGSFVGLVNGLIISKFKVSPFVVTLGVGFLLQGIALILSGGQPVYNVPPNFTYLGWHEIIKIPVIIYALCFISILINLYFTRIIYGRYLYAIGSNEKAAYLSGINVAKHKIFSYVFCGSLTAIGAIFLASRINGGHPVEGANTALQSVAAAVIGGVSLFGGKGKVSGILLGSLLLAFISNVLNIINISSYYQQIMIGIIIILAVIFDKFKISKNYEE